MSRRSTTFSVLLSGCIFLGCGEREITMGPDRDTSGNYWGQNISKEFGRPQLTALYKEMNGPRAQREVAALTCGKVLPKHEYSVTLWPEGLYRERIVRLQMTPRLYRDDECLQKAVAYVFQRNVNAMDQGSPIDYGYKDPLTGKSLGPTEEPGSAKPICSCVPPSDSLPEPAATASPSR